MQMLLQDTASYSFCNRAHIVFTPDHDHPVGACSPSALAACPRLQSVGVCSREALHAISSCGNACIKVRLEVR